MDERQKRTNEVTRGDDRRAHNEEEVPHVWTSASIQKKRMMRKADASSKQLPKMDPIEHRTPKTPKALMVPQMKSPALDTGNYEVLDSSQLDYTILARQEKETGELTFRLLLQAKMLSVRKHKLVAARTLAA